jgi:flagellar biosynthesis/type III secretory pathway chaperone
LEHLFEKLGVLITREISVYSGLLDLSSTEKEAIIKNGVPEINAIVADKQSLLQKLKQLESARKELFCSFSEKSGVQNPNYQRIIDTAKGAAREKLLGLATELEDKAAELRRINALNKALIDTQMKYTSFFLNLITGASESASTYSNSGRLTEKNESYSLLDQTI